VTEDVTKEYMIPTYNIIVLFHTEM